MQISLKHFQGQISRLITYFQILISGGGGGEKRRETAQIRGKPVHDTFSNIHSISGRRGAQNVNFVAQWSAIHCHYFEP